MIDKLPIGEPTKILLSILLFPLLFQETLIGFVWGADDIFWFALAKRIFLLLPALGFLFCCYTMMFCLLTIPFRPQRTNYLRSIMLTWWDFGRSIFSFWGGILKFVFCLCGWIFSLARMVLFAGWLSFQDIVLAPLRITRDVSSNYFRSGVPWLAVGLLVFWSLLEALIFTVFVSPLVIDVISGTAGGNFEEHMIQIPLYLVLFIFVLGSYSLVEILGEAIKSKKMGAIVIIFLFEIFAAGFEVVFLYREFVDALVPWFAQHAGADFRLGIVELLTIAAFAWLGIRGLTWFLFGSAGAPVIIAILRRSGLAKETSAPQSKNSATTKAQKNNKLEYISKAVSHIKDDITWLHKTGDEIVSVFSLPPLQIIASCINFFTLAVNGKHVFDLPFTSIGSVLATRRMMKAEDIDMEDREAS